MLSFIMAWTRRVFAPPSRRVLFVRKKKNPRRGSYITTERNRRIRQLTKLNNWVFNQEAVSRLLYNSPKPMLLHVYYIKIIRNSKAYDLTSNEEKRTRPASKYFLTFRTSIVDLPKRTVFSEWFSVLIA